MHANDLVLTRHVLERFRIHHPDAEAVDVRDAIRWGTPEDPMLVQALTGRVRAARDSRYVSAPDHRGVFVISTSGDVEVVVTYLRLQESQQRFLRRAPTASPAQVTG